MKKEKPATHPAFTISGSVINLVTGTAISGAAVFDRSNALDPTPDTLATRTDSRGRFLLKCPEGATVILRIKAIGYAIFSRPGVICADRDWPGLGMLHLQPVVYNGGAPDQLTTTWIPIEGSQDGEDYIRKRFDADGTCWIGTTKANLRNAQPMKYLSKADSDSVQIGYASLVDDNSEYAWPCRPIKKYKLLGLGRLELRAITGPSVQVTTYRAAWAK